LQAQNNIISTTSYPSTTTAPVSSDQMVLFKSFPPLIEAVTRLAFWGRWKDQGFGNRKGKAYLRLNRNGTIIATDDLTTDFAPHTEQIFQGIFDTKCGTAWPSPDAISGSPIGVGTMLPLASIGDRIELWVIVGGGTSHKLTIKNFRITLNDVATNVFM
jgi:hypothetical protein